MKTLKRLTPILLLCCFCKTVMAQDGGRGFFVRPDVFGGFFLNGGYQLNPYIQASLGIGAMFIMDNTSQLSVDLVGMAHGGIRVYTGVKPWAGLIDYHAGVFRYKGELIQRHSLVGGARYKDLDFGGGVQIMMSPEKVIVGVGPLFTVGWNFRFYEH